MESTLLYIQHVALFYTVVYWALIGLLTASFAVLCGCGAVGVYRIIYRAITRRTSNVNTTA